MTYENFGTIEVQKNITLKDGTTCFCHYGKYFWHNFLYEASPEGIYYFLTFEDGSEDFIHSSEIKFPIQ